MERIDSRRGRPRKFDAPSRTVTLTLPLHVIDTLTAIDPDLGRAIVRLSPVEGVRPDAPPAELRRFGRQAVIVVSPTPALSARTGVELVPLPDGRAIIAFTPDTSPADIELRLEDALDDARLAGEDRATFESVLSILRDARRSDDISLLRRTIMVLQRGRARSAARPSTR